MTEHAFIMTNEYMSTMPKAKRKKIGQFFTSKETAEYMAKMFTMPSTLNTVSILDPGAGAGILSIALIERLQCVPDICTINLTCFENNSDIIDLLRSNLEYAKETSLVKINYEIKQENYITSQAHEYNNALGSISNPIKYDFIIGNPPYMKMSKDAPEALAMPNVCYGAPNLYFLFAAMSMFNLKQNGEMVYIIPRSWTSGAYFKSFREYFLDEGKPEQIHLFVSRDKVFDQEDVLQETIIIKAIKTKITPTHVRITSTVSNQDYTDVTEIKLPYQLIVSGVNMYVYLVSNNDEASVLARVNRYTDTLRSVGLQMKTGLTVDFRNREFLRNYSEANTVPLFYSQHIKDGMIQFPIQKENEYITTEQRGLIQKNHNYLFVKRFTSKEEKRRLQCGIYLSAKLPEYNYISTQNKINFIVSISGQLDELTVYGLYVLFNSTLYDMYYRILNGSTQVNSTEINSMPVPPLNTITALGKKLKESTDLTEKNCDLILEEVYGQN